MAKQTMETITSVNCSYIYFCGYFEDTSTKIAFFVLSKVVSMITFSMFFGIIWYEKFGMDHRRTLVNKIVSMLCWNGMFSMLFGFWEDVASYFCGPQTKLQCLFFQMLRNVIKSNSLFFLEAIVISKYIFIFWLKNPTSVNDDYWYVNTKTIFRFLNKEASHIIIFSFVTTMWLSLLFRYHIHKPSNTNLTNIM